LKYSFAVFLVYDLGCDSKWIMLLLDFFSGSPMSEIEKSDPLRFFDYASPVKDVQLSEKQGS